MKLKQITIATGLALVAGQAFALSPITVATIEINLGGSSAQQTSLAGIFNSLCADTPDVYIDTASSGSNQRAYSCTLKTTLGDPALNGQTVILRHRAQGGSINGVNPVALASKLTFLNVGTAASTSCTPAYSATVHSYSCTDETLSLVPNAGVSDEEPALFEGEGLNLAVGQVALTSAQLALLKKSAQVAVGFGIATTDNVRIPQPNLSTEQVTSLLTQNYYDWGQVNVALAGKPVVICRRAPGSGSQAAMNAQFNKFPCTPSYLPPANHNANLVFDGSDATVIENGSTGGVINCLNAAYNGTATLPGGVFKDFYNVPYTLPAGSAALGIIAFEKTRGSGDRWDFSTLDNQVPNMVEASKGNYDFWVEQSFQYRNSDVCVTNASNVFVHAGVCTAPELATNHTEFKPTLQQSKFMDKFIATSGDPAILAAIPGVAALGSSIYATASYPAGKVMRGSRSNNTCQPAVLVKP